MYNRKQATLWVPAASVPHKYEKLPWQKKNINTLRWGQQLHHYTQRSPHCWCLKTALDQLIKKWHRLPRVSPFLGNCTIWNFKSWLYTYESDGHHPSDVRILNVIPITGILKTNHHSTDLRIRYPLSAHTNAHTYTRTQAGGGSVLVWGIFIWHALGPVASF